MEQRFGADLVILNGSVLTVNPQDEVVQAVAVKGKYVLAVGSNEEISSYIGEATTVLDAKGHTVMPGFVDAHVHFGMYGLLDHGIINITYPAVGSIEELKERIRTEAAKKEKGTWIKLQGYDHNKLAEQRHPTKEDLDEAAPDHPVQCTRCCAHMAVYNSAALERVGISSADQFASGEVVLNEDGSIHGLLKETAHMDSSKKVEFSPEELLVGHKNANEIMLSLGITTAHDAGGYNAVSMAAMQDACESGEVKVRLYPMVFDLFGKESGKEFIRTFIKTGVHTGCGSQHYKIGPVKIMLDGSSSGPSSAMIDGYSHDRDNHGLRVWSQEEVDEIVLEAHRAGFQVTAHAVGDWAVTIMVNAIEKAMQRYPGKERRHRIEHCGLTSPELIQRIAKLGIIPISNPSFIAINGSDYNRYYGERVNYMFPLKSYLDAGVITAIGSDSPVTHPDPMNGLYGALNRKDQNTGALVGERQKVDVLQAVRMFTYNGAYASFEEEIKGSLETGKLADLVILTENILTCPPEHIQQTKVQYTLVDGEIVYKKE